MSSLKVYIITGEPSGDVLASGLIKALRSACPSVQFAGTGGQSMAALGFESLFNINTLAVMGFWDVLPRLPLILRRRRQVLEHISSWQPDIIVTVDSWGFVKTIVQKLKRQGSRIPMLHYVAPQVWAWNRGRAKVVAQLVDRLATLLPYEPAYFEKYGLQADFVGHPITERMAAMTGSEGADFIRDHQLPLEALRICVLPGSRQSEVKRLLPVFIATLRKIREQHPRLFVVVPTVATVEPLVRSMLAKWDVPHLVLAAQPADRLAAFGACHFALAASGTVSLELAASRTPHIIAYTFNPVTNFLAWLVLRIKFVNLINILANRRIVPEFLGSDCRAQSIAPEVLSLLASPSAMQQQVHDAQASLAMLHLPDVLPSEKVANMVLEMARPNTR